MESVGQRRRSARALLRRCRCGTKTSGLLRAHHEEHTCVCACAPAKRRSLASYPVALLLALCSRPPLPLCPGVSPTWSQSSLPHLAGPVKPLHMSRRESAADQDRARKREREQEGEGSGREGKKPKADDGLATAAEEARVAELLKKRQAKLKALQEEQAQKEQARPPAQQPCAAPQPGLTPLVWLAGGQERGGRSRGRRGRSGGRRGVLR